MCHLQAESQRVRTVHNLFERQEKHLIRISSSLFAW